MLDCQALGSHGRGMAAGAERVVAVALDRPRGQVLCQVFHEEVHPVSDPRVLCAAAAGARDTRAGTPGHAHHMALETAAVRWGGELITSVAPEFGADYRTWRARFGL